MSRVRRLVALFLLLASVFGWGGPGGSAPPSAPSGGTSAPPVVRGPVPDCATAVGPYGEWSIVCRLADGSVRSRCCWADRPAARAALTEFRRAWRKAAS